MLLLRGKEFVLMIGSPYSRMSATHIRNSGCGGCSRTSRDA
jgi:hypothetical protein